MSRRRLAPSVLGEVPLWGFVAVAVLGSAWLGLPWWTWPVPVALLWWLHVVIYPYAPCRWCGGNPKRSGGKGSRTYRRCGHCGGKGERLRWRWVRGDGSTGGGLSF